MPKSLTVSQLLGRGQLTLWEPKSWRPWSPPHWGARTGREGPRARGPGAEWWGTLGPPRFGAGSGPGVGPRPVRKMGGKGRLARTAFLARQASTSKISAQKRQQGCSQTRQAPPLPILHAGPYPHADPGWGPLGQTATSLLRRGQRGTPRSLNTVGTGAGVCVGPPEHLPRSHPPAPPGLHQLQLSTTVRGEEGGQGGRKFTAPQRSC